jgi:hypothetical protein
MGATTGTIGKLQLLCNDLIGPPVEVHLSSLLIGPKAVELFGLSPLGHLAGLWRGICCDVAELPLTNNESKLKTRDHELK